jgi:proline dehydrogenase
VSAFIPILRSSFLYLSKQPALRRWVETSGAAGRLTSRFIAGLKLEDALRVTESLARSRTLTTLDYLGENVTSLEEALFARQQYLSAIQRLAALDVGATISVKLTALGLDLSEDACMGNLSVLVDQARANGSRVEIDMEDSSYTDRTLSFVRAMHSRHPGSVRCVIQAYLYRSKNDIDSLNAEGIPVRLCKGAYKEPPEVAFPSKAEVDGSFARLMDALLERGTHPAIATHDPKLIDRAFRRIREVGVTADRFEFQMLYGVRRDLQKRVLDEGYGLRLYVPYGTAWYPYFMRRLAERPANVTFILKNLFRR